MLALYIALGGNLGDRVANLAQAREKIARHFSLINVSPLYETPALLLPGAPTAWDIAFLNQVIEVQANGAPDVVLHQLKAIEKEMGRTSSSRWEPRIIDIDILAYGDYHVQSDALNIPHAAMHQRDFVLQPLYDIAPDWAYPKGSAFAGKTASQLLKALPKIQVSLYDPH